MQQKGLTMRRLFSQSNLVPARLPAAILSAAFVLGMTASGQAFATPKEVNLASSAEALAYCKAGKMAKTDIAYFNGASGISQYGAKGCPQQSPKGKVRLALANNGKKTSECYLASPTQAVKLCNDGGVGEYDIDLIAGKVGQTLSGPGYGCVVNFSTSSIGNAICR
jgi:hypothetical protein